MEKLSGTDNVCVTNYPGVKKIKSPKYMYEHLSKDKKKIVNYKRSSTCRDQCCFLRGGGDRKVYERAKIFKISYYILYNSGSQPLRVDDPRYFPNFSFYLFEINVRWGLERMLDFFNCHITKRNYYLLLIY